MVFLWFSTCSFGFPMVFTDFPMVFLWFSTCSFGFPMVFTHFPMVFLWFSYGFPMVFTIFLWFSFGFHKFGAPSQLVVAAPAQLAKGHLSSEMPGRQYVLRSCGEVCVCWLNRENHRNTIGKWKTIGKYGKTSAMYMGLSENSVPLNPMVLLIIILK